MNLQECPRARGLRALAVFLLACLVALAASCTNPEKAKTAYVQRGEALLKERRFQEASIEFRNALQIDDNYAAAHWGLARAYEQLGRASDYIEELQKVVKLDPNNVEARLRLANGYLLGYASPQGQKSPQLLEEARRLAGEVLARDPNNLDGLILQANITYFDGDAKKAEGQIKHAIELNPLRVESYMGLARFYVLTNRQTDAEATFKQALSVNDRSSLAHVEYGKFLVQTGRSPQAEAEFAKAADVDPENRDVRWVLASYYLANNRLDKAEPAYSAWAHLDWDKPDGRARLADYYAYPTVGRLDDAIKLYQEIAKDFPDYARAHYRLGELSLQRGDTQGVNAQVAELLKRDPKDVDALFLRARMNSASGKFSDAIADLKTVLDADPRSKLGLYFMSDALYRDGQFEQARARAGELERYYQGFLPAKLLQIQIALDSGDADGAKRSSDDLLNRIGKMQDGSQKDAPDPDMTPQLLADTRLNALLLRGKASLALARAASGADQAKLVAAARADFDAARQGAPNSPQPYVNLADAAAVENKTDEAQQMIERALSIDRTNSQALTALINLESVTGKLDDARSRIEQLANEQPKNAQLQYLVGEAYRHGNPTQPPDPQRAEAAFQRAVQDDADYMPAYNALAEIYVGTNQPDRAIETYKKIIERRQDDFVAYRNIGLIEAGRNNLDAASDYYRRVLSIRPDEPVAENNLAALYADHEKGNAEEAMRLAQDVVRRYPNEAGFADTLGWVYYRKGLYRDAVEQLKRAVDLASKRGGDNSLYRWHLGKALADSGDKAGARRELQKCQELYAAEQQRSLKPPTATPIDDVRRTLESL
jgi:tetratricopeptide (TPR) repeat protein